MPDEGKRLGTAAAPVQYVSGQARSELELLQEALQVASAKEAAAHARGLAEGLEEGMRLSDAENADARAKYKLAALDGNATSMALCASAGMAATRIYVAIRAKIKPAKGEL